MQFLVLGINGLSARRQRWGRQGRGRGLHAGAPTPVDAPAHALCTLSSADVPIGAREQATLPLCHAQVQRLHDVMGPSRHLPELLALANQGARTRCQAPHSAPAPSTRRALLPPLKPAPNAAHTGGLAPAQRGAPRGADLRQLPAPVPPQRPEHGRADLPPASQRPRCGRCSNPPAVGGHRALLQLVGWKGSKGPYAAA